MITEAIGLYCTRISQKCREQLTLGLRHSKGHFLFNVVHVVVLESSLRSFLKDTQPHIIFSPVVIIWVLLLQFYCIFFYLIPQESLLIGISGECLWTSKKKKQEHLFAVLFKNLLTIAFTLSPFHHFFSKFGNGSREDVTGSRKRWSWCLSADLFLFPLG